MNLIRTQYSGSVVKTKDRESFNEPIRVGTVGMVEGRGEDGECGRVPRDEEIPHAPHGAPRGPMGGVRPFTSFSLSWGRTLC